MTGPGDGGRREKVPWSFVVALVACAAMALYFLGLVVDAFWSGEVRTLTTRRTASRLVSRLGEPDVFQSTVVGYAIRAVVAGIVGGIVAWIWRVFFPKRGHPDIREVLAAHPLPVKPRKPLTSLAGNALAWLFLAVFVVIAVLAAIAVASAA